MSADLHPRAAPSAPADALRALGVTVREHLHQPVLNAAQSIAAGLPFDPALLLKTLVFRRPGGWALVAMRALDRLDYGALARAVGVGRDRLAMADDAALREVFGWEPGGAAPLALAPDALLLVDDAVFALPVAFFGGGRPDLTLEADPRECFARLAHRRVPLAKTVR